MTYKDILKKIVTEKNRLESLNVIPDDILNNLYQIYDTEINNLFKNANSSNQRTKAKKIDVSIRKVLKKIYIQYKENVSNEISLFYQLNNII